MAPFTPVSHSRGRGYTPLFLLVILIMPCLSGCNSSPGTDGDGTSEDDQTVNPATPIAIGPILESLQPDQYGISVPGELPTTYLNSWAQQNLHKLINDDAGETELKEKLSSLLTDEQIARVLRRRFTIRDSVHIRDMIWARRLIAASTVDGESDLQLLTRLFYHVVNTVRLVNQTEFALPLSPFDTMLYGRGTAADRVWIFSCLTRQLRLPLFVVEPDEAATSDTVNAPSSRPLIAGLLLGNALYLFDFQLGLPLPSPDCPPDEVLPSVPATLQEVLQDDTILRAFDAGESLPYRATAEQFRQVALKLVGDSSVWARRMEGVLYAMTGQDARAVVFEPLVAHGAFSDGGIIEITIESLQGRVTAESISIWDYPEAQRSARAQLSTEQSEQLKQLHEPMEAPRSFRIVGQDLEYSPGKQMQLQARVQQVLGFPRKAIPVYLRIQLWKDSAPKTKSTPGIDPSLPGKAPALPPDVQRMHARAAIEALYWQATCQLELGKYGQAVSDFGRWIRTFGRRDQTGVVPRLFAQAVLLNGIAEARQGRLLPASAYLKQIPADDPRFQTARILIRRWQILEEQSEGK